MWRAWIERPRAVPTHTYHETEHRKPKRRPKKKTAKARADVEKLVARKPRKTKTRPSRKPTLPLPLTVEALPEGCAVCGYPRRDGLTRHHLVPKAAGGRNGKNNIVLLCMRCHTQAHAWYGPGHRYHGPTERLGFVAEMRTRLFEDLGPLFCAGFRWFAETPNQTE